MFLKVATLFALLGCLRLSTAQEKEEVIYKRIDIFRVVADDITFSIKGETESMNTLTYRAPLSIPEANFDQWEVITDRKWVDGGTGNFTVNFPNGLGSRECQVHRLTNDYKHNWMYVFRADVSYLHKCPKSGDVTWVDCGDSSKEDDQKPTCDKWPEDLRRSHLGYN